MKKVIHCECGAEFTFEGIIPDRHTCPFCKAKITISKHPEESEKNLVKRKK